jgi:two-component system, OmpR family, response regulator
MIATRENTTRVLVVDDNREAATSMGRLLAAAGFQVETSFDGPTALAVAERFEPDACVLDINMPGMDGYELARRLRERRPARPPVLATVTGNGDADHLDRAAEAGFDLHFTKPADPAEVVEQLGESVRREADGAGRKSGLRQFLLRLIGR